MVNPIIVTLHTAAGEWIIDCNHPPRMMRDNPRNTVLVHGFKNDAKYPFPMNTVNELLALNQPSDIGNILTVDWSQYTFANNYDKLSQPPFVKRIAKDMKKKFAKLMDQGILELKTTHGIGYSMGGQILGAFAKEVNISDNEKLGRLTVLDLAGVNFESYEKENKMNCDDALLSVAVHTSQVYGIHEAVGHLDFYINGSDSCDNVDPNIIQFMHNNQPGSWSDGDDSNAHGFSHIFFNESIRHPNSFMAQRANSWIDFNAGRFLPGMSPMGLRVNTSYPGKYYLKSNEYPPYSVNSWHY